MFLAFFFSCMLLTKLRQDDQIFGSVAMKKDIHVCVYTHKVFSCILFAFIYVVDEVEQDDQIFGVVSMNKDTR